MSRRAILRLLIAVTLVSAGLAVSAQQTAKGSALEQVKQRTQLRVGIAAFVPWAMRDRRGEFVGFEIDVARKLADDNGWQLELVETAFDSIIAELNADRFDVIISGMLATPKRSQAVNFTIPYEYSAISLSASKKLTPGWTDFSNYNVPGVILAVRRGSANVEWMNAHFPKATFKFFDDDEQAFDEVVKGAAHAVVSAEPKASLWTLRHAAELYKPFGDEVFNQYPAGFGVRMGEPDLLRFLDNWIRLHTINGWLQQRYQYWFQTDAWFGEVENNPYAARR